jgi:hypothetical protein
MTDKPPKPIEDEPGAQERFEHGLGNALRMPPKPHAQKKPKEGKS